MILSNDLKALLFYLYFQEPATIIDLARVKIEPQYNHSEQPKTIVDLFSQSVENIMRVLGIKVLKDILTTIN